MDLKEEPQALHLGSDEIISTEKPTVIGMCACDQNLEATHYCETHKKVICLPCKTLRHKHCKHLTLNEKSAGYDKNKLNSLLEVIKTLKGLNDNFIRERNADLEELARTKETCIDKMHTLRRQLNALMDDIETNTRNLLDEEESKQKQPIADQISASEIIGAMLQTDFDQLNDAMKTEKTETLFAADVKISDRIDHYCASLKDMFAISVYPQLKFQANEQLVEKLKTTGYIATFEAITSDSMITVSDAEKLKLLDTESLKETSKSFLEKKFRKLLQLDLSVHGDGKALDITGCDFMPNGELVLCDYKYHRIIVLNNSMSFRESLTLKSTPYPYGVACVSDRRTVITLSAVKRLQFVELRPNLKPLNDIQLDKKCWGVKVVNSEIYVTCSEMNKLGRNTGEIRVLDLGGTLIRKIGLNQDGSCMFSHPYAIAVNAYSGNVFVSDQYNGTIMCLKSSDGAVVSKVKDEHLAGVRGVYVDDEDNAIVCGKDTNNVQMITSGGKLHVSVLTTSDGIKAPLSFAFRRVDNLFVVGFENSKELLTMVMA